MMVPKVSRKCAVCRADIAQPVTGRPRNTCSDRCRKAKQRRARRTKAYHLSQSDEWTTPLDRWAEWDREFGFTLDAAATADNALCADYYTEEDDALTQRWAGVVWCNPPYGRLPEFLAKAKASADDGATVVMLIPSRTDIKAWHEHVEGRAEVRFIKGRLRFGDGTGTAPFPSALVIFRRLEAS